MEAERGKISLETYPDDRKDPFGIALAELRRCCDTTLGVRACKEGHFEQPWQRDAVEGAKALIAVSDEGDQRYVLKVLELFLEPKPPYPYLISDQPQFADHFRWKLPFGHAKNHYQLSLGKRLGNYPRIPLFREVLIVDSFQILGLLGECLSSSFFNQSQKKELWDKYETIFLTAITAIRKKSNAGRNYAPQSCP